MRYFPLLDYQCALNYSAFESCILNVSLKEVAIPNSILISHEIYYISKKGKTAKLGETKEAVQE